MITNRIVAAILTRETGRTYTEKDISDMVSVKRYEFIEGNVIHCLDLKFGQNKKLGVGSCLVQTYHLDRRQIEQQSLILDDIVCSGCPLSYHMNGGKSGGCYTHRGLQKMGLLSKIRSGLKDRVKTMGGFNPIEFQLFLGACEARGIELVRFGAYGDPSLLPFEVVEQLSEIAPKNRVMGYTNSWKTRPEYSAYFMASAHGKKEHNKAKELGYRPFTVIKKGDPIPKDSTICPASKEGGKKTTCSKCGLCGGRSSSSTKPVYIVKH